MSDSPRALISVYNKQNLAGFARGLQDLGFEILSSGGTARELAGFNITVTQVSDLTGVDEALGGRLKTLHPIIHAGILADPKNAGHRADLQALGAAPISLVVCNLYDFPQNPSIELIDIGGPAMIRAAAKNYESVGVVIDPNDYEKVLAELKGSGELGLETRQLLAEKAFSATAAYDREIANWFGGLSASNLKDSASSAASMADSALSDSPANSSPPAPFELPEKLSLNLSRLQISKSQVSKTQISKSQVSKTQDLRYGENPHQQGALYEIEEYEIEDSGSFKHINRSFWQGTQQIHGKELSYLNVYDATAGWLLTNQLPSPESPASAVIIKHANPCGAALDKNIQQAFSRAFECDSVSAFGGVVALNLPVNKALAKLIADLFIEVIIAPEYEPKALALLQKKKNIRLLLAPFPYGASHSPESSKGEASDPPSLQFKSVENAVLVQTADMSSFDGYSDKSDWKVVTKKEPTQAQWQDLIFAEKVAATASSNAIVIAKDQMALGIGAGQQNRRDAANIASQKAGDRASGGVCASDGFFPFADGLDGAINSGCSAVIQPGGSIRDEEIIAAADSAELAMVFTGKRRFRH